MPIQRQFLHIHWRTFEDLQKDRADCYLSPIYIDVGISKKYMEHLYDESVFKDVGFEASHLPFLHVRVVVQIIA